MTTHGPDAACPLRPARWLIAILAVLFAWAAALPHGARAAPSQPVAPIVVDETGSAFLSLSAVLPDGAPDQRRQVLAMPTPLGGDLDAAIVARPPAAAEPQGWEPRRTAAVRPALPNRPAGAHHPRAPPVSR